MYVLCVCVCVCVCVLLLLECRKAGWQAQLTIKTLPVRWNTRWSIGPGRRWVHGGGGEHSLHKWEEMVLIEFGRTCVVVWWRVCACLLVLFKQHVSSKDNST